MGTKTESKTTTLRAFSSSTAPVPNFSTNRHFLSWTDSITGSAVRNWKWRVRTHHNASSDMFATKFEISGTEARFAGMRWPDNNPSFISYIAAIGMPYNAVPVVFPVGVVPSGSADNAAAGKFYTRVRNKMSTLKGMVSGAESREAKRMMVSRARSIISTIDPHQRRLKKRWRGAGSRRAKLKALSDSWLELQFGWKPLFSDIEDAHAALNEPTQQYATVWERSEHRSASTSELNWGVGVGVGVGIYKEDTRYSVKYYGEVMARENPTGSKLGDFGLTAKEFLPTAWEILPWSFLVDYFTNVGTIVNALSYATATYTRASKVVRASRTRQAYMAFDIAKAPNTTPKLLVSIPASWKATASSVTRTASVNVPIPSLTWKLPSPRQAINIAALAVSRRLRLFY